MLRSALLFGTLCLGIVACGDDDASSVNGSFSKVARECTEVVYASSPFGNAAAVDRYSMDFVVPAGAQGFLISAYHRDSTTTLSSLVAPSGRTYDLTLGTLGQYHPAALANLAGIPVDVDRMMIPPSPAEADMFEIGRWELRGDSTGSKFCVSLALATGAGTTVDLTVYLVGIDGLAAVNAPRHSELQDVFDRVTDIFGEAGMHIDRSDIRYIDLDDMESVVRFSILRGFEDFQELLRLSTTSSSRSNDALRLNVFLIRGFSGNLPSGLLGVASGVPGAAGVHGTSDSGIVFGVEAFLGVETEGTAETAAFDGNRFLGDVMAHEIGHYLGLFHTTEIRGGNDPLDDTPGCALATVTQYEQLQDCPDLDNLMFPIAVPEVGVELTADQIETMRVNPLVR